MAKLTVSIKASIPNEEKVFELASQLESEMHGTPLNAKTALEFVDELKRRVLELVQIEVSHPALNGK